MECVYTSYVPCVQSFAKQKVSLHRLNGKIDLVCAHRLCTFLMISPFITIPNIPIPCTFDRQITKPLWNTSSPLFLAVTSVYTCLLTCLLQEIFNHFNRKPRMLCASIEFFEWMMRFKFKSIHLKSNVRYGFVGNKWHEHECESKWLMPFRNITFVRSVNVLQKIAFLM